MEKTENLKLNVWEKSDPILVVDFNEDNRKIDAAVGQIMAHAGNCKIVTGTYVGDGKYGINNPTSITFPEKPIFVYIGGGQHMMALHSMPQVLVFESGSNYYFSANATWTENTLKYYTDSDHAERQMNYKDRTYYYMALMEL